MTVLKIITRLLIKQFFAIVQMKSKKCLIHWNKCDFKIISRQKIDRLVVEIFYKKCRNDIESLISLPLIVIDFTDLFNNKYDNKDWLAY